MFAHAGTCSALTGLPDLCTCGAAARQDLSSPPPISATEAPSTHPFRRSWSTACTPAAAPPVTTARAEAQ